MNNELYEDGIQLIKKKRSNRKKYVFLIISLLVIMCIIIAFFVIKSYYKSTQTISFEKYDVYQYFSGRKYNYRGVASYQDDKIINISDDGKVTDIGENPIYFQTIENECIIPINMGLFFLKEKGRNYRVNYFSKLSTDISDDKEMSFVSFDNQKHYFQDAFLYDGNNLYVFPYSVKIKIKDEEYNLTPLSYAIVNYRDNVEIYNKEKDEYSIIEDVENDVIAYIDNYKINLSTDMIMYQDDDRLLIKNINRLNQYNGE